MDELSTSNKRLKTARDSVEQDYEAQITKLDQKENSLKERLNELNKKKLETTEANGSVGAADDDLVEINAGGKIIAAKRSTLT